MHNMKRFALLFIAAASAVAFSACHSSTLGTAKQAAGGAPYELIVIADNAAWQGAVVDTVKSVFSTPVKYVNQVEPMFDVMRIMPSSFTNFLKVHRNVLSISINPDKPQSSAAQKDSYADGQLIVSLTAPSNAAMVSYISENRAELIELFESAERDRAIKQNAKYHEGVLMKKVQEMFGLKLDIPRGFTLRGTVGDSLIVMSYEYPLATQGIAIYSYPYSGKSDFEASALVKRRNEFLRHIPGPSKDSYMTTAESYEPEVFYKRIDGRFWAEMRGFWDVAGDFMGGPMVSWSTLDTYTDSVVTIDCYVFSPKYNKRNYLRGLEHIIYSASFPDPAAKEQK